MGSNGNRIVVVENLSLLLSLIASLFKGVAVNGSTLVSLLMAVRLPWGSSLLSDCSDLPP